MPDLADSIGTGFITTDEIVCDLRYAIQQYRASPECTDAIMSTHELRSEGERVFSLVNAHFGHHYTYSTNNLDFADIDPDGYTKYANPRKGRFETEVYVKTEHAADAATVDYILAHEGTHAALYDCSEWLEELVAMDVAYQLMDANERPDIARRVHDQRMKQTTDALAINLRKDEGWSETRIATYLRDEFGFDDEFILTFVDARLKGETFRKVWFGSRMDEIERDSRYRAKPYLLEKFMHKSGNDRIMFTLGGQYDLQVELPHLMAHTNDATAESSAGSG